MSLRMGFFVRGALALALMVGPAQAVTFTGATANTLSTNALGNGTYNYGSPYGVAGPLTTYTIDASGTNLSSAYLLGDPLLFDGSAVGSVFNIAVDSTIVNDGLGTTLNPSSITFNDAGGAGKTYVFTRATTTVTSASNSLGFANATTGTAQPGFNVDSYNSVSPFNTNASAGSTTLLLDTGFTGKVVLRAQANNAGAGTTTINGGTLEINAGNALPTNGTNSNNPGTVTLAGGRLAININVGNPETVEGSVGPATAQFNGALNVTENSTLANTAVNFDGSGRRQDVWGAQAGGAITISNGKTLNIEAGGGATVRNAITTPTGGAAGTVNLGSSSTYLRLNIASGANANTIYNIGTNGASLDLAATGTANLGHITGASNTAIRGTSGGGTASTNVTTGALNQTGSYGGQILNGFGASNGNNTSVANATVVSHTAFTKNGTGTLTLSGENRYSGATTASNGTLKAGGSSAVW